MSLDQKKEKEITYINKTTNFQMYTYMEFILMFYMIEKNQKQKKYFNHIVD